MRISTSFDDFPAGGEPRPSASARASSPPEEKKPKPPLSDDPKVQQRLFLAVYETSGNISKACEFVGITRRVHEGWKEDDTDYLIAFGEAQKKAADALEQSARDWAMEGIPRHKFYKGQMIMVPCPSGEMVKAKGLDGKEIEVPRLIPYVEYQRSEALLMFLLRANCPEKFGQNAVPGDGPVTKTYVNLKVDEFGTVVREASPVPAVRGGDGSMEERGS